LSGNLAAKDVNPLRYRTLRFGKSRSSRDCDEMLVSAQSLMGVADISNAANI
jgi:hypothetical protein